MLFESIFLCRFHFIFFCTILYLSKNCEVQASPNSILYNLKIATATEDKLNDNYHDETYGILQVTAKFYSI